MNRADLNLIREETIFADAVWTKDPLADYMEFEAVGGGSCGGGVAPEQCHWGETVTVRQYVDTTKTPRAAKRQWWRFWR